jgi:hypothetical protein
MEELEKFELVNKCETFDQLADAIEKIGYETQGGKWITGRSRPFTVSNQLFALERIRENPKEIGYYRGLTRSYGLRQQAIYLIIYGEK